MYGVNTTFPSGYSSCARQLHSSMCAFVQNVVVPSMGDSITEGTVADIHKYQRDPVEENEPILTLETDKVCRACERSVTLLPMLRLQIVIVALSQVSIEVRSPLQGTLQAILVQVDDNVHIGQVIALVDESSHADMLSGSQSASQQTYDALADAASEVSDKTLKGHKARIRFPPRRTSDGHVISAMPAVDQQKYINRTSSSQEKPQPEKIPTFGDHTVSPQKFIVSHFVPRRTLSAREMDAIMLGGAE